VMRILFVALFSAVLASNCGSPSSSATCPSGQVFNGDLQCCAPPSCASFTPTGLGCPSGQHNSADPNVLCAPGGCSNTKCCVPDTCTEYHTKCSAGFYAKPGTTGTPCPASNCTDALCCTPEVGCRGSGALLKFLSTKCFTTNPATPEFLPDDATGAEKVCATFGTNGDGCSATECCQIATCETAYFRSYYNASQVCATGFHFDVTKSAVACPSGGCTDALCCTPNTCSYFTCPSGQTIDPSQANTVGADATACGCRNWCDSTNAVNFCAGEGLARSTTSAHYCLSSGCQDPTLTNTPCCVAAPPPPPGAKTSTAACVVAASATATAALVLVML